MLIIAVAIIGRVFFNFTINPDQDAVDENILNSLALERTPLNGIMLTGTALASCAYSAIVSYACAIGDDAIDCLHTAS